MLTWTIGQISFAIILSHLNELSSWEVASEVANLILNLCYEKKNVHLAIDLGAIQKIEKALCSKNEQLQTNAAGALQSICFQVILNCFAI